MSYSATPRDWWQAARPHTWPNAFAPVIVGSGAAAYAGGFSWWRALLALVVAWALIIGVNYANDYSDGVRGTDAERVGPFRLTGSGAARPDHVRAAALLAFGLLVTLSRSVFTPRRSGPACRITSQDAACRAQSPPTPSRNPRKLANRGRFYY